MATELEAMGMSMSEQQTSRLHCPSMRQNRRRNHCSRGGEEHAQSCGFVSRGMTWRAGSLETAASVRLLDAAVPRASAG